jgi:hypothetical protein
MKLLPDFDRLSIFSVFQGVPVLPIVKVFGREGLFTLPIVKIFRFERLFALRASPTWGRPKNIL